MGVIGKVVKADVALHALKVAAAAIGLYAAGKGLAAALRATHRRSPR
jgi:hypothetical protein